jgi:hypothetical protein
MRPGGPALVGMYDVVTHLFACYIQNQKTHHQTQTFQEEYVAFLQRHEVPFDPRYVFE